MAEGFCDGEHDIHRPHDPAVAMDCRECKFIVHNVGVDDPEPNGQTTLGGYSDE